PTVVLVGGEGKELGRLAYVKGAADWVKKAEGLLTKAGVKPPEKKVVDATWGESYEKAVARAKKEKRLIIADFTGSDWCGWCIKLKKEVFETKEFKDWSGKTVVLLEVDFPHE